MTSKIDTTITALSYPPRGTAIQRQLISSNATSSGHNSDSSSATENPPKPLHHVFPIHRMERPSCLCHDSTQRLSFAGFKTLMALMLAVSNIRLMIENFRKYGVLVCISCYDFKENDLRLGSSLYLLVPVHLLVAYLIELVAAYRAKAVVGYLAKVKDHRNREIQASRKKFRFAWYIIAAFHFINASLNLIIASWVVYYKIHNPGIGAIVVLHAVIVWLKVCSYALTNRDLREALLAPEGSHAVPGLYKSCPYPQNITLPNLCYFWWAPTLVYQPVYPRTERIRKLYIMKRVLEIVTLSIIIWVAAAQYATPLLFNSLEKLNTLDFISIAERTMKLSTISLFCWLCGFYAIFHSFLNLLAEITRFADREFYHDWWNVSSVRTYWTSWNRPVYHFMRRHIYAPLIGRGVPMPVAQFLVFFFSGVLHEVLVGIPTHSIIGAAFFAMVFQIPLILATDPFRKATSHTSFILGNTIFWVTFCLVGQPLAAMLYFSAWQNKYGQVSKIQLK